jgi:hypothetical protein
MFVVHQKRSYSNTSIDSVENKKVRHTHTTPHENKKEQNNETIVYLDRDMSDESHTQSSFFASLQPSSRNLETTIIEAIPPATRRVFLHTSNTDRVFSLEDVHTITERVVKAREDEIRAEYDNRLQTLLREQFDTFTKFNHDYLQRQPYHTSYSYVT